MTKDQRAPPRIVCAAVRLKAGVIVCGPRHFDMTMRLVIDKLRLSVQGAEQGFVDQFGTFYSRKAAYQTARDYGQRNRDGFSLPLGEHDLYSEDLY